MHLNLWRLKHCCFCRTGKHSPVDTDWPFQGPPRPEEASFEGDAAYESGIAAVGQRVGSKLCGSPAAATWKAGLALQRQEGPEL